MHVAEHAGAIDLHMYCTSTPVTGTHHVDLDEARASDLHKRTGAERSTRADHRTEGGRERLSEGEWACVRELCMLEGWVTL